MSDAPPQRWRDRWTEHYEVWHTLGGRPVWLLMTTHSRRLAEREAAAWEARPPARDEPSVFSDEERAQLREIRAALLAEHGPTALQFGTRIRRRAGIDPQITDQVVLLGTLGGVALLGVTLKHLLPAHVWTWVAVVVVLGVMVASVVSMWFPPHLDLDAWTPAWDGTEDNDG